MHAASGKGCRASGCRHLTDHHLSLAAWRDQSNAEQNINRTHLEAGHVPFETVVRHVPMPLIGQHVHRLLQ